MFRSIATASLIFIGLAILPAGFAAADGLVPTDDPDLERLRQTAYDIRALAESNYCAGNDIRSRVPLVVRYLQDMQAWLAPARHDGIAQLKSILANEVRDTNRVAELERIVSIQEALLKTSEIFASTVKTAEKLTALVASLDRDDPKWKALGKTDPPSLFKQFREVAKAGSEALEALEGQSETLVAKLRAVPKEESVDLPQDVRDAVRRFNASLPTRLSTLSDLVEVGKKLKELYKNGKDYADLEDFKATAIKWLSLAARWRQSRLVAEIKALIPDIAATRTSWDRNYAEYRRLRVRAETVAESLDVLGDINYDTVPCGQPCPADLPAPPSDLGFGELKYDPARAGQFAEALRTFTPEVTGKYTDLLNQALTPWIDARLKDPPTLSLDRAAAKGERGPEYLPGEAVTYKVHPGPTCHGVTLRFGFEVKLPPFYEDVTGSFLPFHGGWWEAALRYNDGLYLQRDVRRVLSGPRDTRREFHVPIDSCIKGRWRSKSAGLLLFEGVKGGSGIDLAVGQDGIVTIAYSDMAPLRYQIAPGSPELGEDVNSWSGDAKGSVDIWDHKVRLNQVLASNLTHTYRNPQQSTDSTNVLKGMGPAMFEATVPYSCDAKELRYSTRVHTFVFERREP